ncbi:MAG TPA: LptE family protein, partial [bacterium]|nr:LptE family protein [bacterium]
KSNLPTEDTKVYIPDFENKTDEPGLDTLLTQKVIQNFLIDGRLQVATQDKADMLLQGTIERYDRLVMTRDENQVPQQYRLQVKVDLTLYEINKPGQAQKQLWTTKDVVNLTPGEEVNPDEFDSTNTTSLSEFTTYYVLNVAGVPPEDEPTAQNRLLDQMAGRVVRRTIDGF